MSPPPPPVLPLPPPPVLLPSPPPPVLSLREPRGPSGASSAASSSSSSSSASFSSVYSPRRWASARACALRARVQRPRRPVGGCSLYLRKSTPGWDIVRVCPVLGEICLCGHTVMLCTETNFLVSLHTWKTRPTTIYFCGVCTPLECACAWCCCSSSDPTAPAGSSGRFSRPARTTYGFSPR